MEYKIQEDTMTFLDFYGEKFMIDKDGTWVLKCVEDEEIEEELRYFWQQVPKVLWTPEESQPPCVDGEKVP